MLICTVTASFSYHSVLFYLIQIISNVSEDCNYTLHFFLFLELSRFPPDQFLFLVLIGYTFMFLNDNRLVNKGNGCGFPVLAYWSIFLIHISLVGNSWLRALCKWVDRVCELEHLGFRRRQTSRPAGSPHHLITCPCPQIRSTLLWTSGIFAHPQLEKS